MYVLYVCVLTSLCLLHQGLLISNAPYDNEGIALKKNFRIDYMCLSVHTYIQCIPHQGFCYIGRPSRAHDYAQSPQ